MLKLNKVDILHIYYRKESLTLNFIFRSLMIVFILALISACSEQKVEVIELQDKNFSCMLMIQKMEGNTVSEEMNKIVRDKQKIEKLLAMIEGLEVRETDTDKMADALKSQDSYSFNFARGKELESGKPVPYSFILLIDGTFFFTNKDVNSIQQPRMTILKHKELLNEMKQLLEVDF